MLLVARQRARQPGRLRDVCEDAVVLVLTVAREVFWAKRHEPNPRECVALLQVEVARDHKGGAVSLRWRKARWQLIPEALSCFEAALHNLASRRRDLLQADRVAREQDVEVRGSLVTNALCFPGEACVLSSRTPML